MNKSSIIKANVGKIPRGNFILYLYYFIFNFILVKLNYENRLCFHEDMG